MTHGPRRRVVVLAWWYPSRRRPQAGTFVYDHARAAARDSEVVVVAFEPVDGRPGGPLEVLEGDEGGLRTLRIRYARRASAAAYGPGALIAARRLARSGFAPDVVHAHVYMAGLLGAPLARAWRAPLVLSEHLGAFQLPGMHPLELAAARIALRQAAVVCPPSASLQGALARLAPRARFRIVPNVVRTDLFLPPPGPRADGRILYVGGLEAVKGIDQLLAAAQILRERGTRFELQLVGGGSGRERYEAAARRLGLAGAVRFTGPLPKPAVAEAMRAATVLVAPSLTESFGIAPAEALACGVPVVASRTGALPERIDESSGLLVPPAQPGALADALETMLARHREYDGAALAARVAPFGPDAVADAWSAVYADLTARWRRGT